MPDLVQTPANSWPLDPASAGRMAARWAPPHPNGTKATVGTPIAEVEDAGCDFQPTPRRSDGMPPNDPLEPLHVDSLEIEPASRSVSRYGQPIRLRRKEYELLLFLARRSRRVVTREAIAHAIWSDEMATWTNLVAVTVCGLRRRIEMAGKPTLLHTIRGQGYRLGEDHTNDNGDRVPPDA